MHEPRYFDYAATTPVDPRVAEKMMQCLTLDGNFGNPASRSHKFGWFAEEAVDNARAQIAQLINADPREIIFTSGATESNNLALKGAALHLREKGKHIITVQTEHKAVLDVCAYLETQGFDVTYLSVQGDGRLDLRQLQAAMRADTILVSVMHVNNETGVLQDIEAIGQLCNERGVLLHVDAAQSAGKVEIDLATLGVDLMSFSSHKIYGPKGIGALFVRRKPGLQLEPLIHGGGHERGMRSGTLATHQIVGMGEAFELAQHELLAWQSQVSGWYTHIMQSVQALTNVTLNGHASIRVKGIINLRFDGIEGETMMMTMQEFAISTGSACTSFSVEPSYVLKAMGLSDDQAHSSLRFSLGRFTTDDDVHDLVNQITQSVVALNKSVK